MIRLDAPAKRQRSRQGRTKVVLWTAAVRAAAALAAARTGRKGRTPASGLLVHVGTGGRFERPVLGVAESLTGRPLAAGAGDQPFGPRPPPRALLHGGRLEPLVGIRWRGRRVPAVITRAVRRVDDRLDVTGFDEGH